MKVSVKWLNELVDLTGVTPEALGDALTAGGLEVEEIARQAKGLEKVRIVEILERAKHPDSDRLSFCHVSLGAGTAPLGIVCGAQNMKAGDRVALAQVGAELPNGMKIGESKIRGVISKGMLCSVEELGIAKPGEKSEGILILPKDAPLGEPLAEFLGLDETVLHFKLTANRGDCLSHAGMAREAGALLGRKFTPPAAKARLSYEKDKASGVKLALLAGEKAPQFLGVRIKGVKVGPSPEWVQKRLEAVGSRSINNVVDATNLVLLELGHPVHAYDAAKVADGALSARLSKAGEKLGLLDGTEIELTGQELVIADGADAKRPVGLAGVMGGGNSEVSDSTREVILECAEFHPGTVRRAASRFAKRTEASQRFEKGIDPQGLERVMARLVDLVQELAGGEVVGAVVARVGAPAEKKPVRVSAAWMESFLGMPVTQAEIERVLTGYGCRVKASGEALEVTPPSYRLDLRIPEDLAEEVARTLGYDRIPSTIPTLSSAPGINEGLKRSEASFRLLLRAKAQMAALGFHEALTYAFTSREWLKRFGYENPRRLVNPLSDEHEALVPSLLPGLVKAALANWHHHFGSELPNVRLFELRPITPEGNGPVAAQGEMDSGLQEQWKLAFVASGNRIAQALKVEHAALDLYDIKALVESWFQGLGARGVRVVPAQGKATGSGLERLRAFFHPGQSMEVMAGKDVIGQFGLIHPSLEKGLKLRAPLWAGELDWAAVAKLSVAPSAYRTFKPWPFADHPGMERDFAVVVSDDISAEKLLQSALKAGKPLIQSAKVFDVYRGSQLGAGRASVAVKVVFGAEGRSLTEAETEQAGRQILDAWKKELGVELRG